MRSALPSRLKHLETVRAVEENSRLKVEFAYPKLLPCEYKGLRHIVSVSKRPDGRCNYEERPGPPPNHAEKQDPKSTWCGHMRAAMRTVEPRIREPRNRHEGRLERHYEGCSAKTTAATGGSASCRTPPP
jgi:hypothetical protein